MNLTQEEKDTFAKDIENSMDTSINVAIASKQIDNVNPSHYTKMKISPNEYITANCLEWEVGNAIKYVSRYENKNGKEDLLKAIKYIELLIERKYKNEQ